VGAIRTRRYARERRVRSVINVFWNEAVKVGLQVVSGSAGSFCVLLLLFDRLLDCVVEVFWNASVLSVALVVGGAA
jgi:hypothetical protein